MIGRARFALAAYFLLAAVCIAHAQDVGSPAVIAAERQAAAAEAQVEPLWLQTILGGTSAVAALIALGFSIFATTSSVRTSRRQLRAYIQASIGENPLNAASGRIWVYLKNVGQTPAYEVTPVHDVFLFPHPLSEASEAIIARRLRALKATKSEMTLGTGTEIGEDHKVNFTNEERRRLLDGTLTVVFAGRVHYRDVFGRPHITHFCHRQYWESGGWFGNYHERGNHST